MRTAISRGNRREPGEASVRPHGRIRNWAAFDPGLRDRTAGGSSVRTVSCRTCGVLLGTTDDPVEAVFIALRHRREIRRASHLGALNPDLGGHLG